MRLDEPLGDGQPQPHSRSVSVHAYEILKNLLMMLRCDARPRVRYAYFYAVGSRQPKPAPFFHRSQSRHAPFPEMRHGTQHNAASARRVLQCVIEQICGYLLFLLVIESECRNCRVKARIQFDAFALKRFRPAFGEPIET